LLALSWTLEHRLPVPDDTKKKRTWAGLICPVCRFVFRVPKDHDGAGVICPACHYLLNIPRREIGLATSHSSETPQKTISPKPREHKETKPIVSRPLSEKDAVSSSGASGSNRRRKARRKKTNNAAGPDWDSKAAVAKSDGKSEEGGAMAWIVGGSLLGLAIVGIGVWLVVDTLDRKGSADDAAATQPSLDLYEPILLSEDEMTDEEKKRQQEIADSVKTGMSVLTDAKAVVKKFLNVKTSAELEALVRTPDVTVPRMRAWYAANEWTPPGAKDVGYGGRVAVKGVMASMTVRLNDYSVKQIALENTPSGYLVDWESWVAWSSMSWEALFEKRPTDSVEVRVHCTLDNYYNRLFNDEAKWIAVRLENPYLDRTIYGYIDKESPSLMRMLADLRHANTVAATIKIQYPKDSVAKNQVMISEYIQNGWVRPNAEEEAVTDEKKTAPNKP